MFNRTTVFAAVFVIAQALVPAYGKAIQGGDKRDVRPQQDSHATSGPAAPNATAPAKQKGAGEDEETRGAKDKDHGEKAIVSVTEALPASWRYREWIAFWANIVLVVVGVGGVIGALVTLMYFKRQTLEIGRQRLLMSEQWREMRRQTKDNRESSAADALATQAMIGAMQDQAKSLLLQANHMVDQKLAMIESANAAKKSADAAFLNAQAVINIERPWVFVLVRPLPFNGSMFEVIATNKGRTPALVLESSIGFVASESLNGLPEKAPYTYDTLVRDKILLPKKTALVFGLNRESIKSVLGESFPLFPGDGMVFVVGRIAYRDLLNPDPLAIHETRWISWYQSGEEGDEVRAVEGVGLSTEYERYT